MLGEHIGASEIWTRLPVLYISHYATMTLPTINLIEWIL